MRTIFLIGIFVLSTTTFANDTSATETDTTRCNVRIGFGSSGSSRCFFDEVMIGIDSVDPLRIRCGRVEVTCPLQSDGTVDTTRVELEGFEF